MAVRLKTATESQRTMNVLLINNYDSFVYNLAQLINETGLCKLEVVSYDKINEEMVSRFDKFIISPGPGIPSDFPKLEEMVKLFHTKKDILGVCLGHEAIALAFGGAIHHSGKVFHGIRKKTHCVDPGHYIFKGIPDGFEAGLYHSWILNEAEFPNDLKITAVADDGVIMAISHKNYNVVGFQYHPESIMTRYGREMVINWLSFNS